ncbi:MAG TPA: hypothetical protein PKE51_00595 [Gemmatimonadaceae bacterium]|nr:hypothetical protein [Gemmatimonadaceae bacterium]
MADSRDSRPDARPNTHPADVPPSPRQPLAADEDRRMARIGVGCFTTFIGAISGAMVGVLVAVGVTFGTRCQPLEGLPACDWHIFAGWGALIGALTLPTVVLWRLRRRDDAAA